MNIAEVAKEAAKILKDYPDLKYYQAIEKAKEVYKKSPQDSNPIGTKKNKT